jgi:carbon storage regulator
MLALTRKPGEVIVIGDGPTKIEIMIVHVSGDKVRVAVDAPRDVSVHRLEVYEKIRQGAETPPPPESCCE